MIIDLVAFAAVTAEVGGTAVFVPVGVLLAWSGQDVVLGAVERQEDLKSEDLWTIRDNQVEFVNFST